MLYSKALNEVLKIKPSSEVLYLLLSLNLLEISFFTHRNKEITLYNAITPDKSSK